MSLSEINSEENLFFHSSTNHNNFDSSEGDYSIYKDNEQIKNFKKEQNINMINNLRTNFETNKQINNENHNIIFENTDNYLEYSDEKNCDNITFNIKDYNDYSIFYEENHSINKEEEINNKKNINDLDVKQKKKGKTKTQNNGRDIHSKLDYDNMRNNLKVNFFNFIISFFNKIIKNSFENQKINLFKKINYIDKSAKTAKILEMQFKKTMKDILKLDIQNNYKTVGLDHNRKLMEKIEKKLKFKKFKDYENLFSMTLSDFYKQIYLSNDKEKLIKDYGISQKEILFVDDLKKKSLKQSEEYLNKFINMASNILKFAGIEEKNLDLNHFRMININNNYLNQNKINNNFNNNNNIYSIYENDCVNYNECKFLNKKRNEV